MTSPIDRMTGAVPLLLKRASRQILCMASGWAGEWPEVTSDRTMVVAIGGGERSSDTVTLLDPPAIERSRE